MPGVARRLPASGMDHDPAQAPAPDTRPEAPDGAGLDTYQQLLDESLKETFPASDPISPGAAARSARRVRNPACDDADWALKPGSEASGDDRPRS